MSETKPGHTPELNKENKEVEPKITVDFFFSAHGSLKDFDRLPAALEGVDVFMPEGVGLSEKDIEWLNRLSAGTEKPPEKLYPAYSFICGSKILIINPDIPIEHQLTEEIFYAMESKKDADGEFRGGDFDEAMGHIKTFMLEWANLQKQREVFIIKKIKETLKTLTQRFPQLKNKKEIRVLVTLGAAHTDVHKQLKSDLQLPLKILGRDIISFGTGVEIIKKLQTNPEEIIPDEMYARSLMQDFITHLLGNSIKCNDNVKILRTGKKLVTGLSLDKIRLFSEQYGDMPHYLSTFNTVADREKFNALLEQTGVKLPKNEEEMDKLLNIRKK